jgi:hypothetical protein
MLRQPHHARSGNARAWAWPLVAFGLLTACGGQGPRFRLEGSLSQLMNLQYDEARIRLTTQTMSLDFVRKRALGDTRLPDGGMTEVGTSEDFVLQIGYQLLGDAPPNNQAIDLTFLDENGNFRTTLARNVVNDPRRTFPPLRVGSLFLDRTPDPVAMNTVNGDFNITFENGVEIASGRTVFGKFAAKVIPP